MRARFLILLRQLFYVLLVRPLLILVLGISVRHLDRLQARGAHVIAANHNSHLDALVLMSLIPFRDIPKVKLVAARDYFCRTPLWTWISLHIIGIIPIDRKITRGSDPLRPVMQALQDGYTVIIFPEGSRGDPEQRRPLKYGVARIVEIKPWITVTPVFMYGTGKALPRGEALLVPFVCEVNIGEPLVWQGKRGQFIAMLEQTFSELAREIMPKAWS